MREAIATENPGKTNIQMLKFLVYNLSRALQDFVSHNKKARESSASFLGTGFGFSKMTALQALKKAELQICQAFNEARLDNLSARSLASFCSCSQELDI